MLGVHPGVEYEDPESSRVNGSAVALPSASSLAYNVHDEPLRCVVFEVGSMTSIDASAMHHLSDIVNGYLDRSVAVCFVKYFRACCVLIGET